jgi:hypothetical protein
MVYVEYGMRPNYNYSRIIYEVSFGLSDKSMRWPSFFLPDYSDSALHLTRSFFVVVDFLFMIDHLFYSKK